jgi:hypothetical protein
MDLDPSIITNTKQENLDFYCFGTSLWFSMMTDLNVPLKSTVISKKHGKKMAKYTNFIL